MQIPWIKRTDLKAVRLADGWVVKDPIGLTYTQLDDVEYATLNLLDRGATIAGVLTNLRNRFPHRQLVAQDLSDYFAVLAGHQLVRQMSVGDSHRLRQSHPWWNRWLQTLGSLFRIRLSLFNPTRLVDSSLETLRSFAGPISAWLAVLLLFCAGLMAILRCDELVAATPSLEQFLGPANLPLLFVVFLAVKLLHEFGHAATARWFGVECRDCGVMFLFMTPILYTDVTDGWMKSRRIRMAITAAGIGVELLIAAGCVLLWFAAEPGILKSLLLNTAVLCSANTLLFNGNPLLKFDGYYLLSDAWQIPNLSSRASESVREQLIWLLTGQPFPHSDTEPQRIKLLCYGWSAAIYRTFLILALLHVIDEFCQSWNLPSVGILLKSIFLITSVIIPMSVFSSHLVGAVTQNEDGRPSSATRWIRVFAALTILLLAALIPFPESTVVPAVVEPDMVPVYVRVSGYITPVTEYGDRVNDQSPVANLHNPEVQQEAFRLKSRADELSKQLTALISNPLTDSAEIIPSLRKATSVAEERHVAFKAEQDRLNVVAKAEGVLFPPPVVSPIVRKDVPQIWHGRPLDPENRNTWLSEGTLLGYVGRPNDVTIVAFVDEDSIDRIYPGQRVAVAFGIHRNLSGTVESGSSVPMNELPLSLVAAGRVTGQMSATGVIPNSPTFAVSIRLNDETFDQTPPLYSVGDARISLPRTPLVHRVLRFLNNNF